MSKIIGWLAALALSALAAPQVFGQSATGGTTPSLQSFEFIGCSGDWDGKLTKPEVWRATTAGRVSFLTHHVATCGLEGRDPTASFNNGVLNLAYELHSPSDAVIMCDCEYWAKFTFGTDASGIKSVMFSGQQAELQGDWPVL